MQRFTVHSLSPVESVSEFDSPWIPPGGADIIEHCAQGLDMLHSGTPIIRVRISGYGPCVATYRGYFNKALQQSRQGQTKRLVTKHRDGYLYIRLADKLERKAPRQGKVKHVIR